MTTPAPRRERFSRLIEQALARALPRATTVPRTVHAAMRYCVLSGGKRFRPLLCLGACEAVGAPVRQALPVAVAIELIHTYSLVHDDLPAMDNATLRRGSPTCHQQFGEGTAILVGDALLTRAFQWLGRNGIPNAQAVFRTLSRACGTDGLIGGQALDLRCKVQGVRCKVQALEEVARRKTAALITASVVTGALAAGASAGQRARLTRYGRAIGLAFQLVDDVQDGDGLATVLGPAAVQAQAQRLIAQAVKTLAPFGARAQTLQQLADQLLHAASSTREASFVKREAQYASRDTLHEICCTTK